MIGFNTFALPPILQIGNLNGVITLYVRSVEVISTSGVRFGSYVTAFGHRVNDHEFQVTSLRVDRPPLPPGPSPYPDGSAGGGGHVAP
ncbi:MAG: hypothetical protein IT307_02915 [Chloroflexi bacterium]|nr:hypothetical protein [Chloroflexota bacterium]